jgi:hypothetical protein
LAVEQGLDAAGRAEEPLARLIVLVDQLDELFTQEATTDEKPPAGTRGSATASGKTLDDVGTPIPFWRRRLVRDGPLYR